MEFQRFIRTHLSGLRVLAVSTERYVPGIILTRDKLRMLGHCREILPDLAEDTWQYTTSEASMMYGSITASRKLKSGLKVMGIFSLQGRIDRDLRVHVELSDIRGASLKISQLALRPHVLALRSSDRRGRWRDISGQLIVMETFYASAFTATFMKDDQLVTQTELEELTKLDVEASVDFHWHAGRQLVVTQNDKVPFGVRGFVV